METSDAIRDDLVDEPSGLTARVLDIVFRIMFLVAGIAAIGWMLAMAGGFPLRSMPFWTRWLVSPFIALTAAIYLFCDHRSADGPICDVVKQHLRIGTLGFLAAMIGSARYHFPYTMRTSLVLIGIAALVGLTIAIVRRTRGVNKFAVLVLGLIGVAVGAYLPMSQRGLDPKTEPNNSPIETVRGTVPAQQQVQWQHAKVDLVKRNVVMRNGDSALFVSPMLKFISCSPDRCWTLFSPRQYFSGPSLAIESWSHQENSVRGVYSSLSGPAASWRVVRKSDDRILLDVRTEVERETYSHLNSFTYLAFDAPGKKSISFSLCGDQKIEITESDYPVGRPSRFCYLDAENRFHVVESSSAEKGPFTELASGRLDQPFAIHLYNNDKLVFSIGMNDWPRQASKQMSPTAGWGVPENAIEFRLSRGRASIFVTLAGTSVGRGFQSVGHSSGVYQNRMEIVRAR